jgi:HSP20 family molecular chaperone IbpA
MAAESTLARDGRETSETEHTRSGEFFRPNVDIFEKPEELVLVADMPGVKSDTIDVDFEDGTLTIFGKVPSRHDEVDFVSQEYGVGNFYREFRVSEQVDASRINADYRDGVLTLHLPKAEAAKPRKIEVRAK